MIKQTMTPTTTPTHWVKSNETKRTEASEKR